MSVNEKHNEPYQSPPMVFIDSNEDLQFTLRQMHADEQEKKSQKIRSRLLLEACIDIVDSPTKQEDDGAWRFALRNAIYEIQRQEKIISALLHMADNVQKHGSPSNEENGYLHAIHDMLELIERNGEVN